MTRVRAWCDRLSLRLACVIGIPFIFADARDESRQRTQP